MMSSRHSPPRRTSDIGVYPGSVRDKVRMGLRSGALRKKPHAVII